MLSNGQSSMVILNINDHVVLQVECPSMTKLSDQQMLFHVGLLMTHSLLVIEIDL